MKRDPTPNRLTGTAPSVSQTTESRPEPRDLELASRRRAVVLLSGGLDSATTLAIARATGFDCFALTVDYGQRHAVELERARSLALYFGVPQRTVAVDLAGFGGSVLTGAGAVPHPDDAESIGERIPATYVPARNTVLLSLALSWAETLEAYDLFLGANVLDYSGYPDCRPEFLEAFETVANLGTQVGVEGEQTFRVRAPLLRMTKADIIQRAAQLDVPFQLTHSCYDPTVDGLACGLCDSCILRRRGFQQAGISDPTSYAG